MIKLNVNGETREADAEPDTPLLWVLRDSLGLTGTKFGCGVLLARDMEGKTITTIEGLGRESLHAVQQAWIDHQVPQCGYCQSGMIMAAVGLLARNRQPSDVEIDAAITNICRCGTYPRVRAAIHAAARGQGA